MNILKGATLTLSVPMALDTVTIEEGAQLRSTLTDANQKVTAKVLRFVPELSGDKWMAPLSLVMVRSFIISQPY